MAEGGASETWRRAQQQRFRGQSGEISTQRTDADQHSPASVGSQEEDWGWLHEHSLKGASVPQLARRESGKRSGATEEARDFFLPLCFVVHKEKGLRATLKGAPETSVSHGYQRKPQRRA